MSGKPSSTPGFERRFNPALRHCGPDDFVGSCWPTCRLARRPREIRAPNRLGVLGGIPEARGSG
jgi:hypothetical protein